MHRKIKWSRLLAIAIFAGLGLSVILSDLALKHDFDKIDKSDTYWTFQPISKASFTHLKITGGNLSNIAFQPSPHPSVRVLKSWEGYDSGDVKTSVRADTLFIEFPQVEKNPFDKVQMATQVSLRIFGPVLHSVTGVNTNLVLEKFDGRDMKVALSGKSRFEIETIHRELGNLEFNSSDSSHIEVELSPEISGNQEIRVSSLSARLADHSLLEMGHAQIDSLDLTINDISGFQCSGATWNKRTVRN